MKSQILIALTVAGVLGTASAAMAVNSDTLASMLPKTVSNASKVLEPKATTTPEPVSTPEATETPEPAETAEPKPTAHPATTVHHAAPAPVSKPNPVVKPAPAPAPAPSHESDDGGHDGGSEPGDD